MLHFVIAIPSLCANWCEEVAAAAGGMARIRANTPEELSVALIKCGASDAVIGSSRPGGQLRAAIIQSGQPFILVQTNPYRALAQITGEMGIEFPAAVRAVASSYAAMLAFNTISEALILHTEEIEQDLAAAAAAIVRHLGFPPTKNLASYSPSNTLIDTSTWRMQLDQKHRDMAEGALGGFLGHGRIIWLAGLFIACDSNTALDGPVDITGRARCLIKGPFITLPEGSWRITIRLAFSETALEYIYQLEVTSDTVLGSATFRPEQAGDIECQFDIVIDGGANVPLIVSLSIPRAAFDGMVMMQNVSLVQFE